MLSVGNDGEYAVFVWGVVDGSNRGSWGMGERDGGEEYTTCKATIYAPAGEPELWLFLHWNNASCQVYSHRARHGLPRFESICV